MDLDRYLTELPSALLQPHVILPAQHFHPPKKLAPEHRLMMAVLNDAVRCVEKYRSLADARGRRLFHEAQQWLLAAESHWPYSFEHICAVLDLDANAVRHRLRLAPKRQPVSVSCEMRRRGSAAQQSRQGVRRRTTATNWDHTEGKWNDAHEDFHRANKERS